ncbi:MAG: helix-turn-helix domain-containing protein [Pseudomonadota bacterium]
MPEKRPHVPMQIAPLHEAIGFDDTVEFLLEFGGARLYIPKKPTSKNEIARHFGLEKAHAIAKVADRLPTSIPTAKPFIAAALAYKGYPISRIARKLHMSENTIARYLGRQKKREFPQRDLFD